MFYDEAEGRRDLSVLLQEIFANNEKIPVILFSENLRPGRLSEELLRVIDEFLCVSSGIPKALAGRIADRIRRYLDSVCPKFFGRMTDYAQKYRYAWHTPGHMGGAGFLKSPAGAAFYKFYGENALRSDLSISVSELGSLLDHSGAAGEAEKTSARVFGADQTYYVLNGTSTANQIVWSSQVKAADTALLDRNCHKSLYHAMIRTRARPSYMIPRRNSRGIIGPVRLREFSEPAVPGEISMMTLTNSTYDGLCYNVKTILDVLPPRVLRIHFDEAWFAYAAFHPLYRDHYGLFREEWERTAGDRRANGMDREENCGRRGLQEPETAGSAEERGDRRKKRPLIFCSQSTHKMLTALSQASMLHIRNGSELEAVSAAFNESYMMYASTSPQYSIIASLDVATKMMQDQGYQLNHQAICNAVELRKKLARSCRAVMGDANPGDLKKSCGISASSWAFGVWQPKRVSVGGDNIAFEDADTDYLASHQEPWILSAADDWHGFEYIEENYVMLDPVKLTVTTPGVSEDGSIEEFGIPALIVSRFLSEYGIVCEKADCYSFLILNSIGVDEAKQSALLAALAHFRWCCEKNTPLREILPELAETWPEEYGEIGLADHCRKMHEFFRETRILQTMHQAFEESPQMVLTPAEAYERIIKKEAEFVELADIGGRTAASVVAPYPPGIPLIMGGELVRPDSAAFRYLELLQKFENRFPGYGGAVHGAELFEREGKRYFRILCVRPSGHIK